MKTGELDSRARVGSGICGCILESSLEEFPDWLNYSGIDIVEWRIDRFARRFDLEAPASFYKKIATPSRHTLIATNRPPREMGTFEGTEEARLQMLEDAAAAGVEWVDIEYDVAERSVARFHDLGVKVLVSSHHPVRTPSRKDLEAILERMARVGADALKIATFASSTADIPRVLELIPLARAEFATDLIAFCMGPAAKWSRVACLMLGSPWTYAQLPGQPAAAPGQLSPGEIRTVLDILEK